MRSSYTNSIRVYVYMGARKINFTWWVAKPFPNLISRDTKGGGKKWVVLLGVWLHLSK